MSSYCWSYIRCARSSQSRVSSPLSCSIAARRGALALLSCAVILLSSSDAAKASAPAGGQERGARVQEQRVELSSKSQDLPDQISTATASVAPQPELLEFDFRQSEIRTLVAFMAHLGNLIAIIPDSIKGKVSVSSSQPLTMEGAFRVLSAILDAHDLTLLRDDRFLRVIKKDGSVRRATDLYYGRDPGELPLDDRVVTQIVPLENSIAARVVATIQPLISTTGIAFVSDQSNILGLTDSASNVRRLLEIIGYLDVERPVVGARTTRVYSIRYLKAAEIAAALTAVFGSTAEQGGQGGAGGAGGAGGQASPTGQASQGGQGAQGGQGQTSTPEQGTRITPVESANALIVTAERNIHPQIESTIAALDLRRRQVLIEVKIVEGTLSKKISTGVNLLEFLFKTSTALHKITGGLSVPDPFVSYTLNSNAVDLVLTAAADDDIIRILSAPRVLTADNEQAYIIVAQEEPILKSVTDLSTGAGTPRTVSDFEYRDVGIELTVTPRINVDRDVNLEVEFKISSILANVPLPGGTFAPRIGKREGRSNVTVRDGTTLVIGGLLKDDYRDQRKKVPVLGSIPLLGRLFSNVQQIKEQTELLVFITPHVAIDNEESVRITKQEQEAMSDRFKKIEGDPAAGEDQQ